MAYIMSREPSHRSAPGIPDPGSHTAKDSDSTLRLLDSGSPFTQVKLAVCQTKLEK